MEDLNDMTIDKFRLWTIHALKVFLSKRNQSLTGTFEELVARTFCAWEQGVPVDHGGEAVEMRLLKEYKAKLQVDGDDILPDPFSLSSGWTSEKKGIDRWPSVYITDIATYIEGCGYSDIVKKLMSEYKLGKAYRYFDSGWVREVFYHEVRPNSDKCLLKAKVTPSQGTNNACYNVWVCVRKDLPEKPGGEIVSAYCTCTAGMYGTCNHIAGVLFRCEHAVKTGETSATCTSKPSSWNVPKGKPVFKPLKTADVIWRKGHYTKTQKDKEIEDQKRMLKKNFTPFKEEMDNTENMRQKLFSIANEEVKDSCFCLVFEGRRLKKETLEMPHTIIQSAKQSASSKELLEKIKLSEIEIQNLKTETINQSETAIWHEQRKGRITASNFKRVCSRVDTLRRNDSASAENLVKAVLGKVKNVQTKAMKHGIALEAFAKKEYNSEMKKLHKKFKSSSAGLQICKEKPFLGASVDLETSCFCCGYGLCEIKCPETIKDQKPTAENVPYIEEKDGSLSLQKNHQYFFQIQGQMAISNRMHCDLYVFSCHGSIHVRVPFDKRFWTNVEEKLTWFWMNYVLCALMDEKENEPEEQTVIPLKVPVNESEEADQAKDKNNNINVIKLPGKTVRRALLPFEENMTTQVKRPSKRRKNTKKTPLFMCGKCGSECVDNPKQTSEQSVCCDKCEVWVHYLCAGETDESVELIDKWVCLKCLS